MVNSLYIKQVVDYLNLSIVAFEKATGIGSSTISKAIKQEKDVSNTIIGKILDAYPNISMDFLKKGIEPMFIHEPKEILQVNESEVVYNKTKQIPQHSSLTQVPFYDIDFIAGYSSEFLGSGHDNPLCFLDLPEFSHCIAFCAYSDSMEPIIKSGSILLGRKIDDWQSHLEYGQIYGITTTDNRRYLKFIRKAENHNSLFLLRYQKEGYDDFEIPKDKIKKIWLIEGWINRRV